jgi:hypothetical protein
MMGIVYAIVARNATQARQHFAACVRCDKDHYAALNNLAVAEVRLGMHADAAKHLIDALTLNPSAEVMQNSRRLIELPMRFPAAKNPALDELNATFVKIEGAGTRRPSFSGSKWVYMLEDNRALADYGLDTRVSPKALQDDTCPMCNGQGKLPCDGSGCVRGSVLVHKTVVIGINPATGGAITETQPGRVECRECSGSGTRTCPLCGGSRRF